MNESKKHMQSKFGAIPGFMIIGYLAWMIKVFIGTFYNNNDLGILFEVLLVLFSLYACAYVSKLIYSQCEEKNLRIFGSSSKIIGIAISVSLFLLLNIFVHI